MFYTIRKEPQHFFLYNNGVRLIASKLQIQEIQGQLYVERIRNLQIVNGGQTAAILFHAKNHPERPLSLSDVWVYVSLSLVEQKDYLGCTSSVQKISKNTNLWTESYSLYSTINSEFQNRFYQLCQRRKNKIPFSPKSRPSYWYYEKLQNSYAEDENMALEKPNFARKFPHHFDIKDLSMWCLSWEGYPDIASRVYKCCQYFLQAMKQLEAQYAREGKNEPWEYVTDEIFQDTVAKGILFRNVHEFINKQNWFKKIYTFGNP